MAQEDSRQEGRRAERWARVNFPNKFVHPHEYTARDGRVFDKMFVSIPPGVTLNGVDLGGYAFDHFAKPREIEQKANGRPVAINFRPGEPVRLFRGVGPERRTLEISNPWDLCRAVKAHNDEYARSRQEAAAMSAEASQARGAAGGADEFDTFGEPADVQDGYLPGDPADPTTMLDWTGNGVLDRFLEDESLFGEFLRTPVSEGGVESLVVEPPHIVVEVGA